jgi:hypothetical protein
MMFIIPPPISMELARQRQQELQAAANSHNRRYRTGARHLRRAAARRAARDAT